MSKRHNMKRDTVNYIVEVGYLENEQRNFRFQFCTVNLDEAEAFYDKFRYLDNLQNHYDCYKELIISDHRNITNTVRYEILPRIA